MRELTLNEQALVTGGEANCVPTYLGLTANDYLTIVGLGVAMAATGGVGLAAVAATSMVGVGSFGFSTLRIGTNSGIRCGGVGGSRGGGADRLPWGRPPVRECYVTSDDPEDHGIPQL